jgi:hypothetical protein
MSTLRGFKQVFSLAAMLALALSLFAAPGIAWSGIRDDVRDLHSFLRDHPRISSDVRGNPSLMNSRRYLDQHEDLARFLRHRPALRDEVRVNPHRVLGNYDRYDRYGRWR